MVVSFTKIENTARGVFLGAGWGKEYSVGPTEFHGTVGYPREQLTLRLDLWREVWRIGSHKEYGALTKAKREENFQGMPTSKG